MICLSWLLVGSTPTMMPDSTAMLCLFSHILVHYPWYVLRCLFFVFCLYKQSCSIRTSVMQDHHFVYTHLSLSVVHCWQRAKNAAIMLRACCLKLANQKQVEANKNDHPSYSHLLCL